MEPRIRRRLFGFAAAIALVAASTGGVLAHRIFAQEKPAQTAPAQGAPEQPNGQDLGAELVAALKASPGCLGVDLGMMKSGKLSIFAWFENKKAVLDWYYGDAHQSAMGPMAAGIEASQRARAKSPPKSGAPAGASAGAAAAESKHVPLEFVPDGTGPILCVATITPSEKPEIPGFPMPIRQISIELYQPLPGGVSIGGTFAPDSMKLEHHQRIGAYPNTPPSAPAAPKKG
jgi:hypothetical protein